RERRDRGGGEAAVAEEPPQAVPEVRKEGAHASGDERSPCQVPQPQVLAGQRGAGSGRSRAARIRERTVHSRTADEHSRAASGSDIYEEGRPFGGSREGGFA